MPGTRRSPSPTEPETVQIRAVAVASVNVDDKGLATIRNLIVNLFVRSTKD
jgi:hypothetical protein